MTLLGWLTFLLGSLTVTLNSPTLLDLFYNGFLFIGKSWSWSLFAMTFRQTQNGLSRFILIAYDYSRADWGGLCDHLRDIPREDILKLGNSAAASEFWVSWFRLELMYLSLI